MAQPSLTASQSTNDRVIPTIVNASRHARDQVVKLFHSLFGDIGAFGSFVSIEGDVGDEGDFYSAINDQLVELYNFKRALATKVHTTTCRHTTSRHAVL